jgi:hypothetical protein
MMTRAEHWIAALCLGLAVACEEQGGHSPMQPAQSETGEDRDLPPQLPPQERVSGGQTGSGGLPPKISCENVALGGCATSLRNAFHAADTPLTPVGSECVRASALDATLDEFPVCRCGYTRARYFSDTGDIDEVQITVGLDRRRVALGAPSEGCEVWYRGAPSSGVCLVQSNEFAGCSIDAAASSCQSVCQTLSSNYANVISASDVEVLAATCVQCNSGYCVGVLRSRDACYFGLQYSLNFGYGAASIPCEGSGEEMLSRQLDASGYSIECELPGSVPACESATGGACTDAGATGLPDAGGPSAPDAAASDAG